MKESPLPEIPPSANGEPIRWGGCIVLPENRSAIRAAATLARALAAGRRPPVIPLLFHGPTGVGKSHLAAELLKRVSASSQVFTAQMISIGDLAREAAANPEANLLADRDLAACDLLVLEDMQRAAGRDADALAALLDKRMARRKATVITADAGPANLKQLPRRLTSRLAAGLVIPLEPLALASRRLILEVSAKERKLRLAPGALDWLAEQTTGGVRPLLGLLGNLAASASQFPGPLDRAAVQQILTASGAPPATPSDVARIVKQVAAAYGVTRKELLGPSRLRRVMVPRQVAMYLARELSGLSLPRLGSAFGGRDHTTVLHACRKVEAETETDVALAGMVRQLRAELA